MGSSLRNTLIKLKLTRTPCRTEKEQALTRFGGGSFASIAGSGASCGELDIVAVFGVLVAAWVIVSAVFGLPPKSPFVTAEECGRSQLLHEPLVLDSDRVDLAQVIRPSVELRLIIKLYIFKDKKTSR